MQPASFPLASPPLLSVLFALAFGCNKKQAENCEQALQVTRQAVVQEDFAAASQWREYAWKQCDDRGTLEGLDREIVAAQGQVETRERVDRERREQTRELLKAFLSFVAGYRNNPDQASAAPSCDPPAPGDRKKDESKDRLCTATRAAGSHAILARYWAAEPAAARFSVKLPDVSSCEEIGAPKILKTWSVAATGGRMTSRSRCEFTSGPLLGMHAVLSQAVNADLYVFAPAYLDREPALRVVLEGP